MERNLTVLQAVLLISQKERKSCSEYILLYSDRKNRLREKMERIESSTKYESEAKIRLEKKRTLENSTIEDLQKEFKDS